MVKANSSHSGRYRVQVKNVYGSAVSKEGEVSVYQPPAITRQPRDTVITMGMYAYFSLEASGYPLAYQWRQCTTTTWEPIPSAKYNIYSFKPDTHGIHTSFQCIVKAGPDSVISGTVTGTFGVPSVITQQPVPGCTLKAGAALALQIAAEGVPDPRFQWQKMFNSLWWDLANASGASYVKPSVDSGDNGLYRCRAFNTFGADTSTTASVTVYRQPSILQMPLYGYIGRWFPVVILRIR